MFGTLGGPELFLILVVALIVFGPKKLPEIGKSLGRMMNEFKKASNEFRQTLEDEVEADKRRETAPTSVPLAVSATVVDPAPAEEAPASSPEPEAPSSSSPEPAPSLSTPLEPTVSREASPVEPK